jgi:hypothetical protein
MPELLILARWGNVKWGLTCLANASAVSRVGMRLTRCSSDQVGHDWHAPDYDIHGCRWFKSFGQFHESRKGS